MNFFNNIMSVDKTLSLNKVRLGKLLLAMISVKCITTKK